MAIGRVQHALVSQKGWSLPDASSFVYPKSTARYPKQLLREDFAIVMSLVTELESVE